MVMLVRAFHIPTERYPAVSLEFVSRADGKCGLKQEEAVNEIKNLLL